MHHTAACDFKANQVNTNIILHPSQRPMSLKVHDLLAWTGKSQGVKFDPPESVEQGRTSLYWPELKGYVQDRCPTITVDL